MIMTYDIVADFTTRRYHSVHLAQQYRCAATSLSLKLISYTMYKVPNLKLCELTYVQTLDGKM